MEIQVRFRDYPLWEQAASAVETVPTLRGNDIVRHPQKWGSDLTNHITVALEDRISALTTKDPNKLKVYMGHDVYEVKIGNTVHHIRDDDTINFDGKSYTGKEFYEAYCKP